MASEDLRMRGATSLDMSELPGTIHPFKQVGTQSLFTTLARELKCIISEKQAKRILCFGILNLFGTIILLIWCNSTNSMALTAYTYLTISDMFSLLTCLVTIWVKRQKPSPIYSFGYARFEVLAVFSSTLLAILGSFFILKESIERMVEQPDIHTGRLMVGMTVAFALHMILTYTTDNEAFNHVITASSSSWLQEHMSDISQSVCSIVPGLSKMLLPRVNPFALIGCAGATALVVAYMLIDINNYHAADTWAAVCIAMMTMGTMFPFSVYTGKILLQTTPSHIIGQLDKCIREASTLDGVLEFRHEHFWTLAFGSMAGSVHVRIRRDADEQMVLAHVYHRLANIVSNLTVQIFKDDWSRPSTFQILGESNLFPSNSSPLLPPPSLPINASNPYALKAGQMQGANMKPLYSVDQSVSQPSIIDTAHLNRDILKLLGSNPALRSGAQPGTKVTKSATATYGTKNFDVSLPENTMGNGNHNS